MEFGEYLENCIRKRDLSINALSRECNVNRGGLYSVFKDQRKLTVSQLHKLISKIGLNPSEENELTELYFSNRYGKQEFEKIKLLMQLIQHFPGLSGKNQSPSALNDKVAVTLKTFVAENQQVISNFPFELEEVDTLFYTAIQEKKLQTFTHILELDEKEDYRHNYTSLFYSLKYMRLLQFPHYCWTPFASDGSGALLPYFALGEHSAVIFCSEIAVCIKDKSTLKALMSKVQTLLATCRRFGTHTQDIMQVKDEYKKGASKSTSAVTIASYPCLAFFVDHEIMQRAVNPNLPNKEALVEIAYSHYQSLYARVQPVVFTTESGLKKFAATGNLAEIFASYVNLIDTDLRVRVLENIAESIKADRFFLLDKNKINIPQGIAIEKYANKIFFNLCDEEVENFAAYDQCAAELDDLSMVNTFAHMADYFISSRRVCSKEYSLQFVNNLIAGLACMK